MKWMRSLLLAAASLSLLAPGATLAQVTVSGVKYDESIDLRGTKLVLNGAGVRYKGPFKVYTAGLYLTKKAATPDEVLAMPGPKRLSLTMVREVESNEMGKLFSRGMEDNMSDRTAFSKLIPGVMRMSQIFTDCKKLMPGDTILVDFVPGTGTLITVKCTTAGNDPFKEPEFYNAMLRIWLGPNPADWKLKDALLGKPV